MITHKAKTLVVATVAVLGLSACSSIDCPLNNRVYASFRLAGDVSTLTDTLTVSTPRTMDNAEEELCANHHHCKRDVEIGRVGNKALRYAL